MEFTAKQQEAIESNGNILVSASAGSGKTAVLAERIARFCLEKHINIDKFVVMTFTRLAASEMKAKIIKKLEEKRTVDNEAFLDEQLVLIEKAYICTLDSFNNSLVKDYFYVLGDYDIEPNFSIMESVDEIIMIDNVLNSVFEKHYEAEDERFEKVLDLFANYRGDEDLKDEIKLLYNYSSCMPYPEKALKELKDFYSSDVEVEKTKYYEFFKTYALNTLRDFKNVFDDYKEIKAIESDLIAISNLISNLENGTYDDVRNSLPKDFDKLTIKADISDDEKEYLKEVRGDYKKFVTEKLENSILRHSKEELSNWMKEMSPNVVCMIELAEEFSAALLKQKCKENKFIFDDIAHFAIKILTNEDGTPSKIAETLREQFEFIIVDEYQDTNNLQETILRAIARSNENSNVFMVGDVKQSIYGFRNAEPNIFTNKYNEYKNEKDEFSKKIDLNTNFRSRSEVLDSVNYIFDKLMISSIGEIEYDDDMALHYGGLYTESKENFNYKTEWLEVKEVEVKPNDIEDKESQEYEDALLEIESEIKRWKNDFFSAYTIAKKIKDIMDSDFEIFDNGKMRKVKYSDFAIITRGNENAFHYYKALKSKDIPTSLVAEGSVLTEYEIARVISILKILDNPYDNISMVTVLYSEIFKFEPDELLQIKKAVSLSNWSDIMKSEKMPDEFEEKANYFNETISMLKDFSLKHSIEDLIKKVYEVTNLEKYITGLSEMKSKSSSMRTLLEYTRKYEKYGNRNLYDFIVDINKMLDADKDITKTEEVETGDTVNVVTMHKSKGLEYGIVFVPALNKSYRGKQQTTKTRVDKDLGYVSKFIDSDKFLCESNFYFATLNTKSWLDQVAEEIRIFYVALTRAKEKLYLVGNLKEKNTYKLVDGKLPYCYTSTCQSYADFLTPIINTNGSHDHIEVSSIDDYDVVTRDEKVLKSKIADYIYDVDLDFEDNTFKYKYDDSRNISKKVSVSEIKRRYMIDDLDDDLSEEEILDTKIKLSSDEVVKKIKRKDINTLAPNEKGTIMHKLVKILDGGDIDAEFSKLIEDGIFTKNELSQINKDLIRMYFKSDVFDEIKNSNFVKRELPFMLKKKACEILKGETSKDEVIIQGIIDCVYEKDGKLIVLDYKTDRVDADNKEQRIEEIKNMYKIQLDIYAEALRNIYDKEVDKKILYLFSCGETVEL